MAEDIHVTEIDVVRAYNVKLNKFRIAAVACGAVMDKQLRNIKSEVESKKRLADNELHKARGYKNQIVKRYEPLRSFGEGLQDVQIAGNRDYEIQAKYQELEMAVNNFNQSIERISAMIAEIGQRTKTFCTILDSEVVGCNRKLDELVTKMDNLKNTK